MRRTIDKQYGFHRSFVALARPVPDRECPLPGPVVELIERHDGETMSVKVLTRGEAEELRMALGCALGALDAGDAWSAAQQGQFTVEPKLPADVKIKTVAGVPITPRSERRL